MQSEKPPSSSQQDALSKREPFDISVSDPMWQHIERGVQIVLGVALVTSFTFLGESWGQEDVPYLELFRSMGNVGFAFVASLLITPVGVLLSLFLRWSTSLTPTRINQIRALLLLITLVVFVTIFYVSARDFLLALMEAQGFDPYDEATWD